MTRRGDWQALVDAFKAGPMPLFLLSLKASGIGLNLTGSDYVIHHAFGGTPASEDQAADRAHGIGQTRQVYNYKVVAKDTIEVKLVHLAGVVVGAGYRGELLTTEKAVALFGQGAAARSPGGQSSASKHVARAFSRGKTQKLPIFSVPAVLLKASKGMPPICADKRPHNGKGGHS